MWFGTWGRDARTDGIAHWDFGMVLEDSQAFWRLGEFDREIFNGRKRILVLNCTMLCPCHCLIVGGGGNIQLRCFLEC